MVGGRRTRAMSTPPPSTTSKDRRQVKPNPSFPPQAAVKMTNDRRRNSVSAPSVSPSQTLAKVQGVDGGELPTPAIKDSGTDVAGLVLRLEEMEKRLHEEVGALEKRVTELEGEKTVMREELNGMRDAMEEARWARKRLEDKDKEQEEEMKRELEREAKERKEEMEKETKARKEWEEKVATERTGLVKELSEIKKGIADLVGRGAGRQQDGHSYSVNPNRQRVVVFADSNGSNTTEDAIKDHIHREERDQYDIQVVEAFHVEDAYWLVADGKIDVSGAIVVVDCLTNDARGTKRKAAIGPEELVRQIDVLRAATQRAKETVICQIKPMRHVNVVPFNKLLHEYLRSEDSVGCQTMIRAEFLKADGFHVLPRFRSVLDRQYACAVLGVPVPCPTPYDDFVPNYLKEQYDQEWPAFGGNGRAEGISSRNGWAR